MKIIVLVGLLVMLISSAICIASADQCDVVAGDVNSDTEPYVMSPSGPVGIDPFSALTFIIDLNEKLRITDQAKARYWYDEAAEYYDNGHYELALACANTSIEKYDNNSNSWTLKGASLYMLGRYSESIYCCDNAIRLNPNDARAWHTKGIALYRLGRYKEAVRSCNRALEIDPSDAKAWQYRRLACGALGCYY